MDIRKRLLITLEEKPVKVTILLIAGYALIMAIATFFGMLSE